VRRERRKRAAKPRRCGVVLKPTADRHRQRGRRQSGNRRRSDDSHRRGRLRRGGLIGCWLSVSISVLSSSSTANSVLTPSPERSCPPKLFASTAETESTIASIANTGGQSPSSPPRRRSVERKRSREILASLPLAPPRRSRRRPSRRSSRSSPIKTMSADSMAMSVPARWRADVCLRERGGVVDAVADHRHAVASVRRRSDDVHVLNR